MMQKPPNYGENETFQVNIIILVLLSFWFISVFESKAIIPIFERGLRDLLPLKDSSSAFESPIFFFPPLLKKRNFGFDV